MRDDDLPEMPAALEMPIGLLSLGEWEGPVDNGMEAVMAIARFMASKSVRLPTLIEPSVRPRPVNNRGSSPRPRLDRGE